MERPTEEKFVLAAIVALRRPDAKDVKIYGIPIEVSGFTKAFREHFKKDPIPSLERLEREGKIVIKRTRVGSLSYNRENGREPRYTWTIYNPNYLPPTLEAVVKKRTDRSPTLEKILSALKSA